MIAALASGSRKRPRPELTDEELHESWRPHPGFIGPVGPPMELWLRDRAKQAAWERQMNLMPESAKDPPQGEAIVDHAVLTAQAKGKALLPEQIAVLDALIDARCASARAAIAAGHAEDWDWEAWGRKTYVLESALSFLKLVDSDKDAREYLAKRFRRGDSRDERKAVDNSADRAAP